MTHTPSRSTEFLFLRHGQTDWNLLGLLQGRTDRPLNATGIAQAQASAKPMRSENIGAIVSSPLLRARQTAEAVSDALDVPVTVDQRLIERNFGRFEGQPLEKSKSDGTTTLDFVSSTALSADAEPWEAVCKRVQDTVSHWLVQHPERRVLFVGHYGVMSALCQQLLGRPQPAKNATPYRFAKTKLAWEMSEVSGG